MNSCLYVGQVRHRRFTPKEHGFSYKLFYVYLDLSELDTVFKRFMFWSVNRKNIACFRNQDHMKAMADDFGSDSSLITRVRAYIERETGVQSKGPIRLLTHFSYFGFRFNPVSFYYCYNEDGTTLEHIIAEVNNTPWGEQHCYLIPADGQNSKTHIRNKQDKVFHVSPFMPMNMQYGFSFNRPDEALNVHMENHMHGAKVFDATLTLSRRAITSSNLAYVLFRFPFLTMKIVMAIYYQALLLLVKRIPIFDHPGNKTPKSVKSS
jgi:uncharacterized protein